MMNKKHVLNIVSIAKKLAAKHSHNLHLSFDANVVLLHAKAYRTEDQAIKAIRG